MNDNIYYESTDKRCKTSKLEIDILAKLEELGLNIVRQVKRRSWVFDAAIQGTKILIEVSGEYWHSLPQAIERDAKKQAWAAQHGYTIITIGEDAYNEDKDGVLLQVVEQVERARELAKVDKVDTDDGSQPLSSYTFNDWRDDFVSELAQWGNVRKACMAASISRANGYKRRETDEEFRLAWDEAIENFCDLLEGTYTQRAIEQSDRALEFLLKANRREKYGDRATLDVIMKHLDISKLSEYQLERLAAGDDPITVLLGS